MAIKQKGMDLGQLQTEVELSTAELKKANKALTQAKQAQARANERYLASQRAMEAGFETLRASTQIGL